jgi:ATP-dependent Lhr-like helicase
VQEERDLHVFLWRGSQTTAVFGAAAAMAGLPGQVHDLGLTLAQTNAADAQPKLKALATEGAVDPARLSGFVKDIAAGKFKDQVPGPLARSLWVRQNTAEINAISEIARSL